MKAFFLLALIGGFFGTLVGAHFLPVGAHARVPSQTSVVANGGRAEEFLIRLPADRLAGSKGEVGGLRSVQPTSEMQLPTEFSVEPVLIEHFKVRNRDGNVIGTAARHWTVTRGGPSTSWSILIPSRGSLALRAPGEEAGALDAVLRQGGYSGTEWAGNVELSPGDDLGQVVATTGEFEGLTGTFSEHWSITGVSETGELRGTIDLNTIIRQQP